MQEVLLFEERLHSEIATLSAHIASNKLLQPRQMGSQNREQHFLCDQIVGVFSSTGIDIGQPSTSGRISESGYNVWMELFSNILLYHPRTVGRIDT